MNEKIERLKTSREAENLAANADRLGAPELAEAARARAAELRLVERPPRVRSASARTPMARGEGECLYMNGVFESVLQEIQRAQAADPGLVCYLQPYTQVAIKRLREDPPSASAPWELFVSVTTELRHAGYRAQIVEWWDKTRLPAEKLASLNAQLAATQPEEGAVHLEGKKGQVGINLIGITGLTRLEPAVGVDKFTKTSDGLPLKERTQVGGYSYVIAPAGLLATTPAAA